MGYRFNRQQRSRREPVTSHLLDNIGCVADAIDDFHGRMSHIQYVFENGIVRDGIAVNAKEEVARLLHSDEMQFALNRAGDLIESWLNTDAGEIKNLFSYYWPKRYRGDSLQICEAGKYLDERADEMRQKLTELKNFSNQLNSGMADETLLGLGFELAFGLSHSKVYISSVSSEIVRALKSLHRENQKSHLRE